MRALRLRRTGLVFRRNEHLHRNDPLEPRSGPWSDAAGVDPEEAFVASLASCHMLVFVDFARRAGFVVEGYVDEAEGVLEKGADGRMAMTLVTLHPRVTWGGDPPDEAAIADLHHRAHDACFIANSVTSEVTVEH